MILRLQRRPTDAQLAQIQEQFADIRARGDYRLSGPLPVEQDETAIAHLPRLVFSFNRRDHGRLRMLINFLNDLPARTAAAGAAADARGRAPDRRPRGVRASGSPAAGRRRSTA